MDDLANQIAHADGRDCKCCAFGKCECACGADWTPAEIYTLRAAITTERARHAELVAAATPFAAFNSGEPTIAATFRSEDVTALLAALGPQS